MMAMSCSSSQWDSRKSAKGFLGKVFSLPGMQEEKACAAPCLLPLSVAALPSCD